MYPKDIQAVILAGGKGTRLRSLGKRIPKAFVKINGKYFLDIIINQLKKNGINKFLILTGYKREQIISYYKKKEGIFCVKGNSNWQTLTRIIKSKKFIKSSNFLLMYCDNYLNNFNLKKTISLKKKTSADIFFSIVKKKKSQKSKIQLQKSKISYQNNFDTNYTEAGYMLINKKFFFKYLNKFRINKLSKYLEYLSNKGNFNGKNYGHKFLCIENYKFIKETKKKLNLKK